MDGMNGDREEYGIDDEQFEIIVQQLITNCLTNDTLLTVVVDSEVMKRLGEDVWERDGTEVAAARAEILSRGLEGVLETIALLSAHSYDMDAIIDARDELEQFDFDSLVVPDDLSGLDDLD